MIEVNCVLCDEVLDEPGALIFSPPLQDPEQVNKFHLCVSCWEGPDEEDPPALPCRVLRHTSPRRWSPDCPLADVYAYLPDPDSLHEVEWSLVGVDWLDDPAEASVMTEATADRLIDLVDRPGREVDPSVVWTKEFPEVEDSTYRIWDLISRWKALGFEWSRSGEYVAKVYVPRSDLSEPLLVSMWAAWPTARVGWAANAWIRSESIAPHFGHFDNEEACLEFFEQLDRI